MTNNIAEKLVNAITPPERLTDRQITLVKVYAKSRMMEKFTIGGFCSENKISTRDWYKFLEDAAFVYYLNQVQDALVPSDERRAYERIKKRILEISEKPNPSIKEIELFANTFPWVIEQDKRARMESLGLTEESAKASNFRTIEEKTASLLSRLKGNAPATPTNKNRTDDELL